MGKKNNLGRAIIKDRFKTGRKKSGVSFLHTTDVDDGLDWNRINLKSVTQENSLDEFLSTAELAGTEFCAERQNISFVTNTSGVQTADQHLKTKAAQDAHRQHLKIPRRPAWDSSTTPEELDQMERESFLDWRRALALLQEVDGIVMTPYERNLDFWRQLWRVVERSDVVVQIVDARNPLLFRCEDLEIYVNEVSKSKINVILINKSDFLTRDQRVHWAKYFDNLRMKVAFFSAVEESQRLKDKRSAEEQVSSDGSVESSEDGNEAVEPLEAAGHEDVDTEDDDGGEDDDDDDEWEDVDDEAVTDSDDDASEPAHCVQSDVADSCCDTGSNCPDILTGRQLIKLFRSICRKANGLADVRTVGLVGYPNVGKSSTINTLLEVKKTPVSSTPGRTKHFQTLYLDETLILCDCPGLVVPSFVSTQADMVVSGVLPIDQMRDFVPPVTLVCENISRSELEATYGILLPSPTDDEDATRCPTAYELLTAYATARGFMAHKGIPDYQRAARYILKDFVTGKLLHCEPPPGVDSVVFKPPVSDVKKEKTHAHTEKQSASTTACTGVQSDIDRTFFSQMVSRAGSHGVRGVVGFSRVEGYTAHQSSDSLRSMVEASSTKPWKRHNNAKKREKLRRITGHLDT